MTESDFRLYLFQVDLYILCNQVSSVYEISFRNWTFYCKFEQETLRVVTIAMICCI